MKNRTFIEQIDAYLDGDLVLTEKQAFETALQEDADLQEAVRWHRLTNKALVETAQDNYIRALADNVRFQVGKLPDVTPEWGFWQHLLRWVKTPLGIVGSLSFVVILSVFVYANTLKSEVDLINEYAFTPADARVAGNKGLATALSDDAFLTQLSTLYFTEMPNITVEKLSILRGQLSPKTDSLRLVLIDYYAAHAHLREGQYTKSHTLFESVLAQEALLKTFSLTSDLGKLRFNDILAQSALSHNNTGTITTLETLSKSAGTKGEVQERCKDLAAALSYPLRRFKVF